MYSFHSISSIQTLLVLNLEDNQFDLEGIQTLAVALNVNQVRLITRYVIFSIDLSMQTLIHLNLARNEMGSSGASQLANALIENQVDEENSIRIN